ncbi:sorbin and SH3 domain-containing protein 2-like isoform X2 [Hypomesus transpacificus]|uniref:sorbin and SH3 domain-containing protein 2-like isoform X2 n=1 Tax=Hypomesus transpacificus TaxID=137520 RepID=UPI001F078437|nr:sorbin and SH3 domain-containing protein 2-like isoform X2 [Hypomesus transpacificus]
MDTDVWRCYGVAESLRNGDDISSSLAAKGYRSVRPNLQRPSLLSQMRLNRTGNATGNSFSHQPLLSFPSSPSLPQALSSPSSPSLPQDLPPPPGSSFSSSSSQQDVRSEVRGHRGHAPSLAPSSQAHNHRKPMAAEEARTPPTHFTGIGPVDQSGIPIAIRTAVERPKDWYKSMFKQIHMAHKAEAEPELHSAADNPDNHSPEEHPPPRSHAYQPITKTASENDTTRPLRQANASPSPTPSLRSIAGRSRASEPERDMKWNVPERKVDTRRYRAEPRSIFDYEPGRSSILEQERQPPKKRLDCHPESSPRGHAQNSLPHSKADRPTDRPSSSSTDYRKRRKSEPTSASPQPASSLTTSHSSASSLSSNQGPDNSLLSNRGPAWVPDPCLSVGMSSRPSATTPCSPSPLKAVVSSSPTLPTRARDQDFSRNQSYVDIGRHATPVQSYADLGRTAPPSRKHIPDIQEKQAARAVYNFKAQTVKELALRKGEIVYILKQIDNNWYEGESHGQVGIFPISYVEKIRPSQKPEPIRPPPPVQARELGQAVARYNFTADTSVELSLKKGEPVLLLRQVDQNWFEGKLPESGRQGIFPVSYVDVTQKSHYPQSSLPQTVPNDRLHPLGSAKRPAFTQEGLQCGGEPFQVLYNYAPRNEDELELREGEVVDVMERCDDGWFVGTSRRSKFFGTFPGNYVKRL